MSHATPWPHGTSVRARSLATECLVVSLRCGDRDDLARGGLLHLSAAFEHDALLDHDRGGRDVALEPGRLVQLDRLARLHVADDLAVNDDRAAGDLRLHASALTD